MIPAALSQAYHAARHEAGLIPRDEGLIVVSGRDRASYLQGLLTNDITALTAGRGCYAAYLTAQGRMISDLYVHELGDVLLLVMPRSTKDTVRDRLDQFIFSEDVQLGDVTDEWAALAVVGPAAATVLSEALGVRTDDLTSMPVDGNRRHTAGSTPVILLRTDTAGVPGYELVTSREHLAAIVPALRAAGASDIDPAAADVLRIEAGIPLFGRDMDEDTIPLEAGIEQRAISFTKGCYVGQEVIIRVLHRGHGRVARKLVGLVVGGAAEAPPPGTALLADGKAIGTVTSSGLSPSLGRPVALGYVKRDFVAPGTIVATSDGLAAEVVALPFAPS